MKKLNEEFAMPVSTHQHICRGFPVWMHVSLNSTLVIDAINSRGRPCRGPRHGQGCSRWRPERHTAAAEAGQVLPLSTTINAEPPAGSYTAASGDLAVYGMLSPMSGGDRGHSEQIKGTHTCAAARARTATCSSATSRVKRLLERKAESQLPRRHSLRAKV